MPRLAASDGAGRSGKTPGLAGSKAGPTLLPDSILSLIYVMRSLACIWMAFRARETSLDDDTRRRTNPNMRPPNSNHGMKSCNIVKFTVKNAIRHQKYTLKLVKVSCVTESECSAGASKLYMNAIPSRTSDIPETSIHQNIGPYYAPIEAWYHRND